jgi:Na+/melibiose symporter-like transporter
LYTGIWTAGEKLALAIGPAAAGAGLALTGYVSGAVQQTGASLAGLQSVMALGPVLFLVPCLALIIGRKSGPAEQEPT